jgi:hypothetical protein
MSSDDEADGALALGQEESMLGKNVKFKELAS